MLRPMEGRRGHWIPWNWCWWAPVWVLRPKQDGCGRTVSAINHCIVSTAVLNFAFKMSILLLLKKKVLCFNNFSGSFFFYVCVFQFHEFQILLDSFFLSVFLGSLLVCLSSWICCLSSLSSFLRYLHNSWDHSLKPSLFILKINDYGGTCPLWHTHGVCSFLQPFYGFEGLNWSR